MLWVLQNILECTKISQPIWLESQSTTSPGHLRWGLCNGGPCAQGNQGPELGMAEENWQWADGPTISWRIWRCWVGIQYKFLSFQFRKWTSLSNTPWTIGLSKVGTENVSHQTASSTDDSPSSWKYTPMICPPVANHGNDWKSLWLSMAHGITI